MALVLGIETSCDETAAAVVADGGQIRSNLVYSQIPHHEPYGGVVPEVAARLHAERLPELVDAAVCQSGATWEDLDAIAVTSGPGLATSLLVGIAAAKALALRLGLPLWAVHHLKGHLESVFHDPATLKGDRAAKGVVLLVSGGHTCVVLVGDDAAPRLVGTTLDDAAGEALDKGARILGLGYPGGPAIEAAACNGDPGAIEFPRGEVDPTELPPKLQLLPELCFSFSGLKTSLLYRYRESIAHDQPIRISDWAASYQEAVVDALAIRMRRAIERFRPTFIGLGGGVARNALLRQRLAMEAERQGCRYLVAPFELCTDNAAMIAAAALSRMAELADPPEMLEIRPNWPLND